MKKLFKSILVVVMVLMCTFVLVGCSKQEKGELSRVTVDVNPSIEFMVDEDQKVVSCTALNDDGSIILAGEAIIGKDVEEATQIVLSLCTETGYIVKSETTVSSNNITISVSGDSEYAKKLANDLVDSAQKFLEDSGISAAVSQGKALAIAELKLLVLNNSTFTEEEVNAMSEEDLLKALKVSRMETAELISEDMKKLYFEAKEYEISFAEKEATANIIKELGVVYQFVYAGYSAALAGYRTAITNLENTKYNTLISPDSTYQETLVKLREAKAKYVEQRSYVASLEVGDLKIQAELKLKDLEEAYNKLEEAYVAAGDAAVKSFDYVIDLMKQAEAGFAAVDQRLQELNFEEELAKRTKELETAMNNTKDQFFAKFEEAHKEDIEKMEADLKAQKEALKESILNKSEASEA